MPEQQQVPINIADLVNLRVGMQQIQSPSEDLTKAIKHFDDEISKAITAFKINIQDPA